MVGPATSPDTGPVPQGPEATTPAQAGVTPEPTVGIGSAPASTAEGVTTDQSASQESGKIGRVVGGVVGRATGLFKSSPDADPASTPTMQSTTGNEAPPSTSPGIVTEQAQTPEPSTDTSQTLTSAEPTPDPISITPQPPSGAGETPGSVEQPTTATSEPATSADSTRLPFEGDRDALEPRSTLFDTEKLADLSGTQLSKVLRASYKEAIRRITGEPPKGSAIPTSETAPATPSAPVSPSEAPQASVSPPSAEDPQVPASPPPTGGNPGGGK